MPKEGHFTETIYLFWVETLSIHLFLSNNAVIAWCNKNNYCMMCMILSLPQQRFDECLVFGFACLDRGHTVVTCSRSGITDWRSSHC